MQRETRYEDLEAICKARRARRDFAPKALEAALIEKILRIARTSPYASGRKNWEVQVVSDTSVIASVATAVQKKVDEIRAAIRPDFAADFAAYAENFMGFARAPALFVPTFRIAHSLSPMVDGADAALIAWERDNYVKSIACVGMLILLAAESLGLAACYMTGPLLAEAEIAPLLKVKRGRNLAAVIPVGYRTEEED
jgi:nitroreductase